MESTFYRFANRQEAGKMLAKALSGYSSNNLLILALPRGGVPVAYEVAMTLLAPMDLWLVRKLGVPGHEELAFGALAVGDICVLNEEIVNQLNISQVVVDTVIARERQELERRNSLYRKGNPPPFVERKTVIIIDDGLATGATMRAAVSSLRQARAGRIIVAVPVGAAPTCRKIEKEADELICLHTPEPFYGVGRWYVDFSQTTDEEVLAILKNTAVSPELRSL